MMMLFCLVKCLLWLWKAVAGIFHHILTFYRHQINSWRNQQSDWLIRKESLVASIRKRTRQWHHYQLPGQWQTGKGHVNVWLGRNISGYKGAVKTCVCYTELKRASTLWANKETSFLSATSWGTTSLPEPIIGQTVKQQNSEWWMGGRDCVLEHSFI